jgi:Zn-dependent peptidase ImmA (M78 family)
MFPFWHRAGGVVTVNGNTRERGRQRFTLAHEIGHYVLPGKPSAAACSVAPTSASRHRGASIERAADRFAVELLMPAEKVRPVVCENGVTLANIEQIRKSFDVSLTAAAYQAVELSDEECAVVFTVAGIVKHYRGSSSWNYRIRTNHALGEYTVARKLFESKQPTDDCDMVYLTEWAREVDCWDRSIQVWEQSMNQINYSTILSLLTVLRDSPYETLASSSA